MHCVGLLGYLKDVFVPNSVCKTAGRGSQAIRGQEKADLHASESVVLILAAKVIMCIREWGHED